jgi:hypothetical protein
MEHRTGTVVSYRFAAFYAIGVLLNFGFLYDKSIPCHKDRGHSCSASWDSQAVDVRSDILRTMIRLDHIVEFALCMATLLQIS